MRRVEPARVLCVEGLFRVGGRFFAAATNVYGVHAQHATDELTAVALGPSSKCGWLCYYDTAAQQASILHIYSYSYRIVSNARRLLGLLHPSA